MDMLEKNKQWLMLFVSLLLLPMRISAQQVDIDTLTNRLIREQLEREISTVAISSYLKSMNADGSWTDVDYVTVTHRLDAMKHLERLVDISIAYSKPGTEFYNSKKVKEKIIAGLTYFSEMKPLSTNWWFNEMGGPQEYMLPLILLKGKIEKKTLHSLSKAYLQDNMDNNFYQGTNRIWVSNIAIYKGCIEDDYALILKGFKSIASTIEIATIQGHEGIKIDNSFHMHRPQLYSGGYGRGFSEHHSRYAYLPVGTSFEQVFTPEKRDIINNLLLEGHQIFSYRKSVDFGVVGRNISRPRGIVHFSTNMMDRMSLSQPEKAEDYIKWKEHVLFSTPYPVPGNKYFWKSDIMTHHGDNYYMSAKVISTRTNGTESINGENIFGYYLPLGATNIMTHGDEYKDIFPLWDWTKIPGTTASANRKMTELPFYLFGANKFAGGVSDSANGVIAFECIYTGILAQKAYFFMGDAMLCLGSGISSFQSTSEIITTINQCYSNGDVIIGKGNSVEKFKGGKARLSGVNWLYHDNVGYVLLGDDSLNIEQNDRTGSWKLINRDGKEDVIKKKLFSAWFSHGKEPVNDMYAYVVIPNRKIEDFTNGKIDHGFEVIQNVPGIQAVKNRKQSVYAVIFYEAGEVDLGDGIIVKSDKKVVLYIKTEKDKYTVWASDPMHKEQSVNITINKQLEGINVTFEDSSSTIQLNFPQGDYQGSTVMGKYKIIN